MNDLKAELFKKQEFVRQAKMKADLLKTTEFRPKTKFLPKSNRGFEERAKFDNQEEEDSLTKSKQALERKTKLYNNLHSPSLLGSDDKLHTPFLVDFERKVVDDVVARSNQASSTIHELSDVQRVETAVDTDKTERTEMESTASAEHAYKEMLRKKWEEEQLELMKSGQETLHYANVQFDEIRTHGVGFYQFAKDEETRQKQMKELNELREQTLRNQERQKEAKKKRKEMSQKKLENAHRRKMIREGKDPNLEENRYIPPSNEESSDEEEAETDNAAKDEGEPGTSSNPIDKISPKRIREWDKNKEFLSDWFVENRIEKLREERYDEFAPPKDYESFGNVRPKNASKVKMPSKTIFNKRNVADMPNTSDSTASDQQQESKNNESSPPKNCDIPANIRNTTVSGTVEQQTQAVPPPQWVLPNLNFPPPPPPMYFRNDEPSSAKILKTDDVSASAPGSSSTSRMAEMADPFEDEFGYKKTIDYIERPTNFKVALASGEFAPITLPAPPSATTSTTSANNKLNM